MKLNKINESYTELEGDRETLIRVSNFLKVERPGAYFEPAVKAGFKSPYHYFAKAVGDKLVVLNGHTALLESFGVPHQKTEGIPEEEINEFIEDVVPSLPFEPRPYQIKALRESLANAKQINRMCTSSGKSLTISLIAEFFRRKGLKGLLLVPNINLLTQFKGDILDYGMTDLWNDTHCIGGGNSDRHFRNSLTISTWQSLQDWHTELDELDYVICDEAHRFASEETSAIVTGTTRCKFKWGFTGTLPDDPVAKMMLIGLFGKPKTYVTSSELIENGWATPIEIHSIILKHDGEGRNIFRGAGSTFPKQLQYIKEHTGRNRLIVRLTSRLKSTGNTLVLFSHTQHGKQLFVDTMKELYPDVQVQNKDIAGKKSFEFQKQYGVYFLNGEDDAKTRERTRQILEEHDDAILISNFALLSTGVNIRKLHSLLLASPLKSYSTITQSIGRGMRLHESKKVFRVYDVVDDLGVKVPSGIFWRQYVHRKNTSYNPEGFPVYERSLDLPWAGN